MNRAAALGVVVAGLLLLALLELGGSGHEAAAEGRVRTAPIVLTSLASIGTVYWRYDCTNGPPRWSLGLRVWKSTATTQVRFKTANRAIERQVQPGDPMIWFPFSGKRVEWLAAGSGGEEGTVVGSVRVDWGYPSREPHCWSYTPPRMTVEFYPRRYYDSGNYLRQSSGDYLRQFMR